MAITTLSETKQQIGEVTVTFTFGRIVPKSQPKQVTGEMR